MKKVIRLLKIVFIVIAVILAGLFLDIFISQKVLIKTYYKYNSTKLTNSIVAVQLTDLHNYQFGKDNSRLVQKVREVQPDVIFMTGDMINEYETRNDIIINLIEKLKDVAPIYISLGNHEDAYIKNENNDSLIHLMEKAGAVVLEEEYIDTVINDQEVRIGGLFGYVFAETYMDGSEQRFMEEFQNTDRFKILLSHVPEGLLLWKSMEYWKVDLVFSGHVHGGQVRIPFIGGLYDPEEGFFPTYTKGMFQCGNGTMILSAGLGSSRGIPRVNNLPEIVVCVMGGSQ